MTTRRTDAPRTAMPAGEQATAELRIGGLDCPHCPGNVEEALRHVEGVAGAHVNRATSTAHITYDASQANVVDLIKAIRTAGYSAGTASMRVGIRNMHCS
jgi:Cu+-exporting ATPase